MSVSRPELYAEQVLSLLFTDPGLSRADLAERLGVDRGNITRVVQGLFDQGLLAEGAVAGGATGPTSGAVVEPTELLGTEQPSGLKTFGTRTSPGPGTEQLETEQLEKAAPGTAGRRKIPLVLNDQELTFLGVEVQNEGISVCGISPYGEFLGSRRFLSVGGRSKGGRSKEGLQGKEVIDSITRAIQAGKDEMESSGRRVLGAGIGISGLVDPFRGRILYSEDLGIKSVPLELQSPLEQELGLPVAVDNDARCCCYDVMTYGPFRHRRNFIYLFCETEEDPDDPSLFARFALGSALVLEGKLHHGSHSTAGEFRSLYAPGDVQCQFAPLGKGGIRGLRSNLEGRNRLLAELSQHLGFLANYLDLEAIFLGGGIEEYRQEIEPLLEKALHTTWLYADRYPKPVDIHFAATGEKPALRGAAALIARRVFL